MYALIITRRGSIVGTAVGKDPDALARKAAQLDNQGIPDLDWTAAGSHAYAHSRHDGEKMYEVWPASEVL